MTRPRPGIKHAILSALQAEPERSYESVAVELGVSEAYVRSLASRHGLRRQKPAGERRAPGDLVRGILD
jgi:hypothetical protein